MEHLGSCLALFGCFQTNKSFRVFGVSWRISDIFRPWQWVFPSLHPVVFAAFLFSLLLLLLLLLVVLSIYLSIIHPSIYLSKYVAPEVATPNQGHMLVCWEMQPTNHEFAIVCSSTVAIWASTISEQEPRERRGSDGASDGMMQLVRYFCPGR